MTKIITDEKLIDELLERSVSEILPKKELLKKKLMSGEQLKLYIGTDATGSSLHLGHATNYMVLERFRKLGHKVYLLIGDFTARIGDPTDKMASRVQLTREDVVENVRTWLDQIRPVLDIDNKDNPVDVVFNHDWLSKMTFEDVIDLASNFTVQRMLERDMFEKRLNDNKPIYVHEFFYPLMQGWDSVVLDVDIEVCGSDQTFNALAGRILLKKYKNKEKWVFVTTLLENPVTKEKMMSKSIGTGVFLDTGANFMFGKIMSQPDENIYQLFVDCTYENIDNINKMKSDMDSGKVNPRDIKLKLAYEIIKIYHGEDAANSAQEEFITVFTNKDLPNDIKEFNLGKDGMNILDVLLEIGFIGSKGEGRKIMNQNGVKIDGQLILEDIEISLTSDKKLIQKGKRFFAYILK
ncbi:MAG: tyrosine--tRNA ligase [Candidatus Absconditabacteria bacterium]